MIGTEKMGNTPSSNGNAPSGSDVNAPISNGNAPSDGDIINSCEKLARNLDVTSKEVSAGEEDDEFHATRSVGRLIEVEEGDLQENDLQEDDSAAAATDPLQRLFVRGGVRDGTSGTGVRSLSPRFQPAAGEIFFEERILRKF